MWMEPFACPEAKLYLNLAKTSNLKAPEDSKLALLPHYQGGGNLAPVYFVFMICLTFINDF